MLANSFVDSADKGEELLNDKLNEAFEDGKEQLIQWMLTQTGVKRSNTSTTQGGGKTTNKRLRGSVERNVFNRRPPRQLDVHEKAHAAYAITQDIMPRMKSRTWTMYDHLGDKSTAWNTITRIYTETLNTATAMHDRSSIVASTDTFAQQSDVIPSGFGMLIKNTSSQTAMLRSAIFPIGDVGLIQKGDNFDQRLGDHINLKAVHIFGRIECNIFAPIVTSGDTPYVLSANVVAAEARPMSGFMDHQRKVRFMLIEVLDSDESESVADGDRVYITHSHLDNGGTANLVNKGAPRLEQILEHSTNSAQSGAVTQINCRAGRWTGIDRKYRRKASGRDIWEDPTAGRGIDFKVHKDISFTLAPRVVPLTNRHATTDSAGQTYQIGRQSYVNVDMFIPLDINMSYQSHAASDTQSDYVAFSETGSHRFFTYLFDDHMDHLFTSGVANPTTPTGGTMDYASVVTNEGYAMTQALLQGTFFFNDDL